MPNRPIVEAKGGRSSGGDVQPGLPQVSPPTKKPVHPNRRMPSAMRAPSWSSQAWMSMGFPSIGGEWGRRETPGYGDRPLVVQR